MKQRSHTMTLAEMEQWNKERLREAFAAVFAIHLPSSASPQLMRGNLSWEVQAQQEKLKTKQVRARLIQQLEKAVVEKQPIYRPGTRLIREWHGETYEVVILDSGYQWNSKTYRSLSQIAKAITGTNWSGPRFFGLKQSV